MIRIYCEKADAILKETQTLTSGMEVYPTVVLTFSSDWDGMGKAAVVRNGDTYIDVLIENSKFVVPYECLQDAGNELIIGISGTNGISVIPTVWCSCGTVLEGTDIHESGNVGTPTTDLVNQMLGYAEAANTAAAAAQEAAEAAEANAKAGAEAWAVGERNGEPVPVTDETYNNNARYYALTAAANTGYLFFRIDETTGHLFYSRTDNVGADFYIDEETGHLMLGTEPEEESA